MMIIDAFTLTMIMVFIIVIFWKIATHDEGNDTEYERTVMLTHYADGRVTEEELD